MSEPLSTSPPVEVVATGFGDYDTGGGAFLLEAGAARRIDWLASTGLAVDPEGVRVARLLRDPGELTSAGELLVSDAAGIELYRRVDALRDAHDVVWHRGELVVSSTSTNELLWLGPSGELLRRWQADGDGDAWHLNSLVVHEDRLLASAFGRWREHRGWAAPGAADGAGFVFDVETGEVVLNGLTRPHDPCRLDGHWAVCDSGRKALVVFDDAGTVAARADLGGFTRGVAVTDEHVHVGLSVHRSSTTADRAQIVVLERSTLREVARVPIPAREVYALAVVPAPLVAGLERGFRTNATRADDADRHALFRAAGVEPEQLWSIAAPLPEAACRTALEVELPTTLRAGEQRELPWTLTNGGGAVLHDHDPYPVRLGWRWFDAAGTRVVAEGGRVALGGALPPGQRTSRRLRLVAPAVPGELLLRVAPLQEDVRWFDDVDERNGVRARVRVI